MSADARRTAGREPCDGIPPPPPAKLAFEVTVMVPPCASASSLAMLNPSPVPESADMRMRETARLRFGIRRARIPVVIVQIIGDCWKRF